MGNCEKRLEGLINFDEGLADRESLKDFLSFYSFFSF